MLATDQTIATREAVGERAHLMPFYVVERSEGTNPRIFSDPFGANDVLGRRN